MTVNRKDFDTQADYDEYVAATKDKVPAWRRPLRQLYGPDYALHADVDARQKEIKGICDGMGAEIETRHNVKPGICDSEFAVGEGIPDYEDEEAENEAKYGPDFKGKVAAEMKRFHEPVTATEQLASHHREATRRKGVPVYGGFICYFPDAILKVAELSRIGNEQHNPGSDLHWDREKSGDELDSLMRHLIDDAKGLKVDSDNIWHKTKVAWRAFADLQKACEEMDAAARTKASPKLDQVWIDKVSREEDVPDAHFDGSDKDDLGYDPTYHGPQARKVRPE